MAALPPFALAPALIGGIDPIDYSTRAGQTLYNAAIAKLPYTFEGKASSLPAFLQAIRDRATSSGWLDIMQIGIGQEAAGNNILRNLLTQYGEITIEQVRNNAMLDYANLPVRNRQVSHQIYQCLRASVNDDVSERLVTETAAFYIGEEPDGPLLLMTLINVYFIKTNATPTQIRLKISDASLLIAELEYDIDKFNTTLNSYVQQLASSHGEHTEDLLAHLCKAYRLVPDAEFKTYILQRIDAHNDGTRVLTPLQLMDGAKGKYDTLNELHLWRASETNNDHLVALTAQLEMMDHNNEKLQDKLKAKIQRQKEGRKKGPKPTPKGDNDRWAWKKIPPKPGQSNTKKVDDKTYH